MAPGISTLTYLLTYLQYMTAIHRNRGNVTGQNQLQAMDRMRELGGLMYVLCAGAVVTGNQL